MTWNYAYTPVIWPSVATVLALLVLAAYSLRRRSVAGALPFAIFCLLSVGMLTCKIIEYLAVDFDTKVFWFKIQTFWWMPVITAMTDLLPRERLSALAGIPSLIVSWVGDRIHPVSSAEELHRLLPASELFIAHDFEESERIPQYIHQFVRNFATPSG